MAELVIPERCYGQACNLEQGAEEIEEFLKKCKDCGMEIGDRLDRIDIGRAFLKLVKKEFFPGKK